MFRTFIFLVITLQIQIVYATGNKCVEEANVACTDADLEKVKKVLSLNEPSKRWKASTMSFYGPEFEGRKTNSENCFTHRDPTVAVNQGNESLIGKIVVIQAEGKERYALVTDTGRMKKVSGKNRDLDTTRSLFKDYLPIKNGVINKLQWKSVASVEKLALGTAADSSVNPDPHKDYEKVISCLKKINSDNSKKEAEEVLAAKKAEEELLLAKKAAKKLLAAKKEKLKNNTSNAIAAKTKDNTERVVATNSGPSEEYFALIKRPLSQLRATIRSYSER